MNIAGCEVMRTGGQSVTQYKMMGTLGQDWARTAPSDGWSFIHLINFSFQPVFYEISTVSTTVKVASSPLLQNHKIFTVLSPVQPTMYLVERKTLSNI